MLKYIYIFFLLFVGVPLCQFLLTYTFSTNLILISIVHEEGPIRPKHVEKGKTVRHIFTTNFIDGNKNKNKILPYTQYDAEVQHF
jgi:hypothetical protein